MEPRRVHIGKAVFLDEVGEMLLEAFAIIGEPRRGGQSSTCADHYGIGFK